MPGARAMRLGLHVEQRGTLREHVDMLRTRLNQAAADLRVRLKLHMTQPQTGQLTSCCSSGAHPLSAKQLLT